MPETDFKAFVEEFHGRISARRFDHYELLGLKKSATYDDIEQAYQRLNALLSPENIEALGESENAVKARTLRERIDRAHEVLTDYAKRQEYEHRGFREASEVVKTEQPPDIARDIYKKAKALYARKEIRLCIEAVEQAIKLEARAEYYQLLGLCQMHIQSLERKAEQSLLKAAEIEPWNAEHFFALGMLFYHQRLPQRALGYFRKALQLEPRHVQAQRKLEELEGPRVSGWQKFGDGLLHVLRKALPSVFRRKE